MFNKRLAYYDVLCGCNNRNFLEQKLKKYYNNRNIYLTIVDIDSFKYINDTQGHQIGDSVLQKLVQLLYKIKCVKYICRYGGDEFIVLHSEPIDFEFEREVFKNITHVSFSYGTSYKNKTDLFDDILKIADNRLYREKDNKPIISMENSNIEMSNLAWFYAMNKRLNNEEWNAFCRRVEAAGIGDKIFKTSQADYAQYVKDFLDGKYIIIRKDN